uniref:Magnesium transporter n=1 Tax=Palpitomonas bilix TaxID=652834 RepID=A0A7S3D3B9_9EUKA|mmetsp:Transcript_20311/g.52008  ORF Transcript_20311/g.52008 Transcript_20311/m.52008 type:complete len:634 (+) Transcript_20311:356-2257(+)
MAEVYNLSQAFAVNTSNWTCSSVLDTGCSEDSALYASPALGIFLSLLADTITPLSFTLQKYVHNKTAKLPKSQRKHYAKIPLWWVGNIMLLMGEIGNFIAYSFAPAAIVAPVGAVGIAWNAIFARLILKEKFRVQDFIGVFLNIGGVLVIIMFAPHAGGLGACPVLRFSDLAVTPQFLGYSGAQVGATIIVFVISLKYGKRNLVPYTLFTALIGSVSVITSKAVAESLAMIFTDQNRFLCATNVTDGNCLVGENFDLYYMALACNCLRSLNITDIRNVDETTNLMKVGVSAASGLHILAHWELYVVLLVMGGSGFVQIMYMNKSMQNFDNNKVVPTFYVLFLTLSITGSAVLYDEFGGCYNILYLLPFCGGVLLVFVAVWVISYKAKKASVNAVAPDGSSIDLQDKPQVEKEKGKGTIADMSGDEGSNVKNESEKGKEGDKSTATSDVEKNDMKVDASKRSPPKGGSRVAVRSPSAMNERDIDALADAEAERSKEEGGAAKGGKGAVAEEDQEQLEMEETKKAKRGAKHPMQLAAEEAGIAASEEKADEDEEGGGEEEEEEEVTRSAAALDTLPPADASSTRDETSKSTKLRRKRSRRKVDKSASGGLAPIRGSPAGPPKMSSLPPLRQGSMS